MRLGRAARSDSPGGCHRAAAILDDKVGISSEATVGVEDGEIALVGLRAVVEKGASLPGGARFPADEDDESS